MLGAAVDGSDTNGKAEARVDWVAVQVGNSSSQTSLQQAVGNTV